MSLNPKTVVVVGASRGIGAAVAQHLTRQGHGVWSVCRGPAAIGRWIQADISGPEGIAAIAAAIGDDPLDALLFMGGVWEENVFTDAYDFLASGDAETRWVINVNAIAPIEITRALAANLAQAANPRAIYIGALQQL